MNKLPIALALLIASNTAFSATWQLAGKNSEHEYYIDKDSITGDAEHLCHRVAIIDRGNIISLGNPADLLAGHPEFKSLEQIFIHLTGKDMRD